MQRYLDSVILNEYFAFFVNSLMQSLKDIKKIEHFFNRICNFVM